ncbi:SKN1-domain-containing protein [Guyanagaster necrorhizus]|uniref:SKN1-domain-containing protein n=1 Tax=Guyanagaster necrorhizus TaxID=856835 RepID=A0A9P7W4E6_9AGAR|nr:SKN1-domain-containing protein [Guyanagaster necrorhizus MCA 3950]KAG7451919.1 SKN1-domain-containing protein [Guyanagaster necrorhizus MCA 3950]
MSSRASRSRSRRQPGIEPSTSGPPRSRSGTGTRHSSKRSAVKQPGAPSASQSQPRHRPRTRSSHAIAQGVETGTIGSGYGPYSDKDPELDDILHNPDPIIDAKIDRSCPLFSSRGWENVNALEITLVGLIALFLGFPIVSHYTRTVNTVPGYNLGEINSTGQVPDLPGFPKLIDQYNLVFSDEFNTDGRTFYSGDDPYWEAVDFNYWPTGDVEWYDPSAAIMRDGKLVLTMTEENIHDFNFKSAMVTSWNKLCFTTGYIEVSISMPGTARTMGNLGRAGYGAITDGTDLTTQDPPPARGGVPEIDIIVHQIDTTIWQGQVWQSYQVSPFNYHYQADHSPNVTTIYDDTITDFNTYNGTEYRAYGYEWYSNPDNRDEGYITWYSDGVESWTMTSGTIGADSTVEISQRLIAEEPLYIILNLGISPQFQAQNYKHLTFPSSMYIDYVRVCQRSGTEKHSISPTAS